MSKTYAITEIFRTIQGEAGKAGLPVVFLRFAGCNMWSGRPEDRAESQCPFCDTDFLMRERLTAEEILARIQALTAGTAIEWVWVSGGEPLLQLDRWLAWQLRQAGYRLGVETNGTQKVKAPIDWLVVSPKARDIVVDRCNDLKLLYPHPTLRPEDFMHVFATNGKWLQPIEDENWAANTAATIERLYTLPGWRLSVQTHKYLEIP